MVAISLVFFLATATGLQSVRPDTTGPSQLEGTILRVRRLPKSSGARSFIGEVLIEQAPQVAGQRPLRTDRCAGEYEQNIVEEMFYRK